MPDMVRAWRYQLLHMHLLPLTHLTRACAVAGAQRYAACVRFNLI